ncbi:MAG: hypothetical protein A2234_11695 [Elusimicrobia bacterium RIFOXYA2_FULL_58_8]|nr:MAG: hypothetical protein A2234_11695 [Elusimicrobia bacterium RIFOXYA2_FULL_58_8]
MTFRKRYLMLVLAALAVAGCSNPSVDIALRRAHLVSQRVYYVPAAQFATAEFAPPPAPDSDAQKADIAAILDWQARRTAADCAGAGRTADTTYVSYLAPKNIFPAPLPPEVKGFLGRLAADLDSATGNMKMRYRRPRPYDAYPGQAVPCIKKSSSYSYPSGHTIFSRVFALVLADVLPGRRDEFLKEADAIALDRVIGGVHYPTDIAAGKVFAGQFYAELLKSPGYREDIEKIKTFLVK